VAGHQPGTYRDHYEQDGKKITHKVVYSLQKSRNTVGPLQSIPSRPSLGQDRKERFEEVKQMEQEALEQRKLTKLVNPPIKTATEKKFIYTALKLNPEWARQLKNKKHFKSFMFSMCTDSSSEGEVLRECIEEILASREWMNHMKSKIIWKKKRSKSLSDEDKDSFLQMCVCLASAADNYRKQIEVFEDEDNEQIGKEEQRMLLFKENLKANIVLTNSLELDVGTLFKQLVPKLYSRPQLEQLLLQAAQMKDWFIIADSETVIFSIKFIEEYRSLNNSNY
jgi:hypothetical protein